MKKISGMTVIAAAMLISSCGTKQATEQPQNGTQRPTRTLRQMTRSEELATENCDQWRALGTATSYVEKIARNEAARDARNQLAQMMKVAVEGAAQDYERNTQENMKSSAVSLGEAIMTQFVAEEVENSQPIWYDTFDLSDGSVQVYTCIEIRKNKKEFADKLNNTLEREGIIEAQYDRDRFIKKMSDGLEEYKKKNQVR